jgi:photosystem II stability/assembly factor-like uncharacterized protein
MWKGKCFVALLLAAGLSFFLARIASAQQLVAPGIGWTMGYGGRVLWTGDNGANWKDITPPLPEESVVSPPFFLDSRRGWALIVSGEAGVSSKLELAHTQDAGATWSVAPLGVPDESVFRGGNLAFADDLHGWLALQVGTSAGVNGQGMLYVTSDAGKTWHLPAVGGGNPAVGPIMLRSPLEGWLLDSGGYAGLHVTRDEAKTWQRIDLEPPQKTDQMRKYDDNVNAFWNGFERATLPGVKFSPKRPDHDYYATYDLPTFRDANHGYLSVTYPGLAVLFETKDDGITWRADRLVTGLPPHQSDARVESAVADSTWIIPQAHRNEMPTLSKLTSGAVVDGSAMRPPAESGILGTSFINAKEGWVFTSYGRLVATTDGGATWTDITPPRRPQSSVNP